MATTQATNRASTADAGALTIAAASQSAHFERPTEIDSDKATSITQIVAKTGQKEIDAASSPHTREKA
jgi:hypothetical protein